MAASRLTGLSPFFSLPRFEAGEGGGAAQQRRRGEGCKASA